MESTNPKFYSSLVFFYDKAQGVDLDDDRTSGVITVPVNSVRGAFTNTATIKIRKSWDSLTDSVYSYPISITVLGDGCSGANS